VDDRVGGGVRGKTLFLNAVLERTTNLGGGGKINLIREKARKTIKKKK
jgi:hypothetical protein